MKLKIIIAEWESSNKYILKKILERFQNIEIIEVNNGYEAWDVIISEDPDIIILDIFLEKIGGIKLTRKIRQFDKFRNTLIIGLSGYNHNMELKPLSDAGFDRFFENPLDIRLLEATLSKFINNSQAVSIKPKIKI